MRVIAAVCEHVKAGFNGALSLFATSNLALPISSTIFGNVTCEVESDGADPSVEFEDVCAGRHKTILAD